MSVEAGERFVAWLGASGGYFHPDLQLNSDATGLSVHSTAELAADTRLISCPFELAITTSLARAALAELYPNANEQTYSGWSERMLVAVYVILHWIHTTPHIDHDAGSSSISAPRSAAQNLRHQAYVDVLPTRKDLRTPSYFLEAERGLLKGTNLEGVVRDREAELREEYGRVKAVVTEAGWEQYLAATTYISSRAFPSRLLSLPPADDQAAVTESGLDARVGEDDASYPVLLPGLDLFNHSRGQPITWLSSPFPASASSETDRAGASISTSASTDTIPSVSFLNPEPIRANTEVFNNYGPKSNEELLLSYGFVIPSNPDDTLILRLGSAAGPAGKPDAADAGRRFALRRDGEVPKELLQLMRTLMGGTGGDEGHVHGVGCGHDHDEDEDEDDHAAHEREMEEMQLEMDVLGELGGMLEDKLEKLRAGQVAQISGPGEVAVRDEIRKMVEIYRQGQIDIIEATQDKLSERIDRLEGLVDQGMGTCPCGC